LGISHLSHAYYMSYLSLSPWFDHPNNIWLSVQVAKLLIMQSSPASHHFLPLMSKHSPQYPVLKHSQSCSSFDVTGQVSHPYKIMNKSIVVYILIVKFLETSQEEQYSEQNGSKLPPNLICS
jgi:hypothetical protein